MNTDQTAAPQDAGGAGVTGEQPTWPRWGEPPLGPLTEGHLVWTRNNPGDVPYVFQEDVILLLLDALAAAREEVRVAKEPIPDTYACQRCGRRVGLDAVAPNAMWAAITEGRILGPAGEVGDGKWNILCLWCMDERAVEMGLSFSVTLHFNGHALYGTSQSDADQEHISRFVQQLDAATARAEKAEEDATYWQGEWGVSQDDIAKLLTEMKGWKESMELTLQEELEREWAIRNPPPAGETPGGVRWGNTSRPQTEGTG